MDGRVTREDPRTGSEGVRLLAAERSGHAFVQWRDGADVLQLRLLEMGSERITIGRHSTCDVSLAWDGQVSRTHAVIERIGHGWTLSDDGLSRNGTYLNGERLSSRSLLVEGDAVRLGATLLVFRDPALDDILPTRTSESLVSAPLTPMQRKVLLALCRPYKYGGGYATPATNTEIARELVLSVDAIKAHMRGLFERFDVGDLPQNQKRTRVVELAFRTGIVAERDL